MLLGELFSLNTTPHAGKSSDWPAPTAAFANPRPAKVPTRYAPTDLNCLEPATVVAAPIGAKVAALVIIQLCVLPVAGLVGGIVTAEALVRVLHAEVRRSRFRLGTVPSANLKKERTGNKTVQ